MTKDEALSEYIMENLNSDLAQSETDSVRDVEYWTKLFEDDPGSLIYIQNIWTIPGARDRITEVNQRKESEFVQSFGQDRLDDINTKRKKMAEMCTDISLEDAKIIPAPVKDGEISYVIFENAPQRYLDSGRRSNFGNLGFYFTESYLNGELQVARISVDSFNHNDWELFYQNGTLKRTIQKIPYFSGDFIERLYRDDGTLERTFSNVDDEYDFGQTIVEYAADGETPLLWFSYENDSNLHDHYTQEIRNVQGQIVFRADFREEDNDIEDVAQEYRMERTFVSLKTGKDISKKEFLDELNAIDGETIINSFGISKEDLLTLLSNDFGMLDYIQMLQRDGKSIEINEHFAERFGDMILGNFIEDGIVTEADLDNNYIVRIWVLPDGSIEKICEGENFTTSKYNSKGELVSPENEERTAGKIEEAVQAVPEQLTYPSGDIHGVDEVIEAVQDRTTDGVNKAGSEIVQAVDGGEIIPEEQEN